MVVTGRLALVVGLGVVPLVVLAAAGLDPWTVAGGWVVLLAILTALDVALAGAPERISVDRDLPARARLGEPVEAILQLTNNGSRRLRGHVRDAWQPTAGAPHDRLRVDIPVGESGRLLVRLLPRRRGEVRSDFVVVRSSGPLGLAGRQARTDARGTIRVLPPFVSRRHLPPRLARLRELDGNTAVLLRGQGTEFDGFREYVRGDDVRSIDWRATARAGSTMLRLWRPERDRHIVIVIDTGRTSAVRVDDGVRLDAALEAALLLSALAAEAGDHVHLVMFDRVARARVTGRDGRALVPALVDAMATVDPQLIDTDWDAALAEVRRLRVRPSLVVFLTAQDTPESARSFLTALPSVTRSASVLVGAATDTGLLPDDEVDEGDATGAYVRAAAARAARDARVTARAIERTGAAVVVDSAETLPPLIADRYLALKAAGRL